MCPLGILTPPLKFILVSHTVLVSFALYLTINLLSLDSQCTTNLSRLVVKDGYKDCYSEAFSATIQSNHCEVRIT